MPVSNSISTCQQCCAGHICIPLGSKILIGFSRVKYLPTFLLRFMSSILALRSFILFMVMEFSRLCCAAAQPSPSSSSSAHTLYTEPPLENMSTKTFFLLVVSSVALLIATFVSTMSTHSGAKSLNYHWITNVKNSTPAPAVQLYLMYVPNLFICIISIFGWTQI